MQRSSEQDSDQHKNMIAFEENKKCTLLQSLYVEQIRILYLNLVPRIGRTSHFILAL